MANSCQNYTRDKILICQAGHIKWTKFSPEVNEFPSHLMETNLDLAHYFLYRLHRQGCFHRAALLHQLQLLKSCSVSSRSRQLHDGVKQADRLDSQKQSWPSSATDFWLASSSCAIGFEKYQVSNYMFGQSNDAVASIVSIFIVAVVAWGYIRAKAFPA